jgi:tellurite resistance-related uncharacterized protein
MKEMPDGVSAYRRTPTFTEKTVPSGLLKDHSTVDGAWAKIVVEEGTLRYVIHSEPAEEVRLSPGRFGVIEPRVLHHVEPVGEVRFYVEFYRRLRDQE